VGAFRNNQATPATLPSVISAASCCVPSPPACFTVVLLGEVASRRPAAQRAAIRQAYGFRGHLNRMSRPWRSRRAQVQTGTAVFHSSVDRPDPS